MPSPADRSKLAWWPDVDEYDRIDPEGYEDFDQIVMMGIVLVVSLIAMLFGMVTAVERIVTWLMNRHEAR